MQNKSLFVLPNDPILTRIAEPVPLSELQSNATKEIIKRMFSIAYGEQKDAQKPLLVGLAASQIGISKQIILVDVAAGGKGEIGDLKAYINPEVIELSKKTSEWYEGCFSTSRVCGIVSRPVRITVKAYTEKGEKVIEKYEGYTARIFQHEIDHLNGKVFVDYVTDPDKLHWVEEEEFPEYRDNGRWRSWKKKCSFEKWKKIKEYK